MVCPAVTQAGAVLWSCSPTEMNTGTVCFCPSSSQELLTFTLNNLRGAGVRPWGNLLPALPARALSPGGTCLLQLSGYSLLSPLLQLACPLGSYHLLLAQLAQNFPRLFSVRIHSSPSLASFAHFASTPALVTRYVALPDRVSPWPCFIFLYNTSHPLTFCTCVYTHMYINRGFSVG